MRVRVRLRFLEEIDATVHRTEDLCVQTPFLNESARPAARNHDRETSGLQWSGYATTPMASSSIALYATTRRKSNTSGGQIPF